MARPKKEKNLQHKHQIMLRLTDTQYEIISTNTKNANLSLAKYARKQLMSKKVIVKYDLVADLPEFGKIGSNLNQIARHFSSGGIHSQKIRTAINESIADIYEIKYEVLKLAGDFTTFASPSKDTTVGKSHGNTKAHSE